MALPVSKTIQVKANTVDVSSSIDWPSLDLVMVLTKEVSTFKFNIKLYGSKYVPIVGDTIDLYETTTLSSVDTTAHIFGGTITEVETTVAGALQTAQVTCTDWGYKMDGKLIAESFVNMDPADIVAAIVPAGFDTTTYVQRAGYLIPSIKFNYQQPTKCLQTLASRIGWNWYVDADKKVHFFLKEPTVAPFDIDDTSGGLQWQTLDVDVNLQNMKNSVFVIGGVYQRTFTSGGAVDVYKTDGTQLTWNLAYAYSDSTIIVLKDGTPITTGIANQVTNESGFDTIYDRSNKTIRFVVQPGSGHTITIYGVAEIPIVAHALDQVAIAKYGEFQSAIFDSKIKTIQEAHTRALAEIELYGHAVYDVKFNTQTPNLRIGQTINFNSVKFGVSNYPLIVKRIEGKTQTQNKLVYSVECIGSDQVTFVDIMSTLLQQQNDSINTDNTTLEVLLQLTEEISIGDTLYQPVGITALSYEWTSGANVLIWGQGVWGFQYVYDTAVYGFSTYA